MTKEELVELALRFRAVKLWEILDDSMIFGVRLPDGEIGYCCVMGHGGEHYALGLYKGVVGFTTYVNSINRFQDSGSFEIIQTYDCMNCDFENAGDSNLTPAQKKLIRTVANERHIKMCRPKGYPEFIRYDQGVIRTELNEDEMVSMGAALEGAMEVSRMVSAGSFPEMVKLGFRDDLRYTSLSGGDRIPLVEKQPDGTFNWSTTVTPRPESTLYVTPVFDDTVLVERLKALSRVGAWQIKAMHMPTPMKNKEGMFYPLIMVLANDAGMAYPVMQKSNKAHMEQELLAQLGEALVSMEVYPESFLVDDTYSEAILKDFCGKAGIKLEKVPFLPEVEQLAHMLSVRFG